MPDDLLLAPIGCHQCGRPIIRESVKVETPQGRTMHFHLECQGAYRHRVIARARKELRKLEKRAAKGRLTAREEIKRDIILAVLRDEGVLV